MIKVVYIVPLLAPYAIPRYQELAKNENIELHVVVEKDTNLGRSGWRFQKIEGVKTHLLKGTMSKNYGIQKGIGSYKMDAVRLISFGLKSAIRKINPDIVLACNATQIMMLMGKRRYKVGLVVEDTIKSVEGRSAINSFVKRVMFKSADFYIPLTEDAVKFLKFNGIVGPFIKSTWSIDVDFFRDLSVEEIIRKKKEFGMIKPNNYVLTASLTPRKGILQLLDGWKEMNKEFHRNSDLFILGDGILEKEIRKYISDYCLGNVRLVGNKSYIDVSHYLQCADVFILPTLEDLCSLSVLEAMAARKPVLTTIYNGARQFVIDGINGYIFNPLDKENIIKMLEKIKQTDLYKMSMESSKMIEAYSTKKVMEAFAEDLLTISKY